MSGLAQNDARYQETKLKSGIYSDNQFFKFLIAHHFPLPFLPLTFLQVHG